MSGLSDQTIIVTPAMVAAVAASLGFVDAAAMQAAIAAGITAQTPTVVSTLPVRFNVDSAAIVVGTKTVWGMVVDRNLTILSLTTKMKSLTGLGVGLTLKLQKNGVDVAGTSRSVTADTTQTQPVTGGPVTVVPGDYLELVEIGVGVVVASNLYGYISVSN